MTQDSLRAQIGMVTQDTSLLHRSVLDNILYGTPDAGEEAAIAAAKRAQAHEFILGLEDLKGRKGYAAHVGERGVKLSGGQRQRIAIARVLLKDAPILILDEATSALDCEVEAAIQEQFQNLMAGKTVIAIAHRLVDHRGHGPAGHPRRGPHRRGGQPRRAARQAAASTPSCGRGSAVASWRRRMARKKRRRSNSRRLPSLRLQRDYFLPCLMKLSNISSNSSRLVAFMLR